MVTRMLNGYWWAMVGFVSLSFLVYLTSRIQPWHKVSELGTVSASDAIWELLKRQQHGLLALWKATPPGSEQADAILSQIQLNHQIQQLVGGSDSEVGVAPGLCHQVSASKRMDPLVKWQPGDEQRYLLVVCTSGQISNHLICLEKHMYFAALLNRTLVLPNSTVDYDYEKTLDITHMRACLGNHTVLTFSQFIGRGTSEARLLCYMPDCYLDVEHETKLKALGLSWSSKTNAWPEESRLKGYPSHPHASEIVTKFACDDKVLVVGDLFYADVESKLVSQVGGPLHHTCKTVIRPNRLILLTAERFIQTYLGSDFMALHFRRHGFLKFCNGKNESCFFPIPQAAGCISNKIRLAMPQVMYISTDAADSEINLLQRLLTPLVPMVQRPQHDSREKWDALLQRKGLLDDKEVIVMLDKTICAMAKVFIGTPGSTFTDDIFRLRREWGKSSSCDSYLCSGQSPNYVAERD